MYNSLTISTYCYHSFLVLTISLHIPIVAFKSVYSHTPFHAFLQQLGFGLGQAFSLENALAFGLLTMSCSPGGGSSNVWVNLLDGDLDLSLTMTTISTFAALGKM